METASMVLQPFYVTSYRYAAQHTRWRDLEDVWEFHDRLFGDSVSLVTLSDWWWRYSRMALLVRDEFGDVVGTFDASPLEPAAFDAVLNGAIAKADLTAEHIRSPRTGEVMRYWCITSFSTHPGLHRRVGALGALLMGIADRLAALPEVGGPSAWCAVGLSRDACRLLQRIGFRVHRNGSQTLDGKPTLVLTLDSAEQMQAVRTTIAGIATTCARRQAVLGSRRLRAA